MKGSSKFEVQSSKLDSTSKEVAQSSNSANRVGNFEPRTLNFELTRAEKYEKLAFTFCKMGTVGLIAWVLTPPIFVLLVALIAIALYGKAVTLGLLRSRCFLRKPLLIIGFWAVVAIADASWLVFTHL